MIHKLLPFLPKTRNSNPVSKWIRPVFEKKKIKSVLGGLLSATSLMVGVMLVPNVDAYQAQTVQIGLPKEETVLVTKKAVYSVLPEMTGVSQRFSAWHTGLDITAKPGASIYPVAEGTVTMIGNYRWGYGRHIMIDHGNGLTSLYAHLGRINVEEGGEVNTSTSLGEVGLTGRTTGYHLHLEVRVNGRAVNPVPYLKVEQE